MFSFARKSHLPFSVSRARKASSCTASLGRPICVVLWHPCFPVLPQEHSPNLPSDLGTSGQLPDPWHSQNTCSAIPRQVAAGSALIEFCCTSAQCLNGTKVTPFESHHIHWQKRWHHPASILPQSAPQALTRSPVCPRQTVNTKPTGKEFQSEMNLEHLESFHSHWGNFCLANKVL